MKLLDHCIDPEEIVTIKQYIETFMKIRKMFPEFHDYKFTLSEDKTRFIIYGLEKGETALHKYF